jgi:hypothetical protein
VGFARPERGQVCTVTKKMGRDDTSVLGHQGGGTTILSGGSGGRMAVPTAPQDALGWRALLGPTQKGREVIRKASTGVPQRRKQGRHDGGLPGDKWVVEHGILDRGEALLKASGSE